MLGIQRVGYGSAAMQHIAAQSLQAMNVGPTSSRAPQPGAGLGPSLVQQLALRDSRAEAGLEWRDESWRAVEVLGERLCLPVRVVPGATGYFDECFLADTTLRLRKVSHDPSPLWRLEGAPEPGSDVHHWPQRLSLSLGPAATPLEVTVPQGVPQHIYDGESLSDVQQRTLARCLVDLSRSEPAACAGGAGGTQELRYVRQADCLQSGALTCVLTLSAQSELLTCDISLDDACTPLLRAELTHPVPQGMQHAPWMHAFDAKVGGSRQPGPEPRCDDAAEKVVGPWTEALDPRANVPREFADAFYLPPELAANRVHSLRHRSDSGSFWRACTRWCDNVGMRGALLEAARTLVERFTLAVRAGNARRVDKLPNVFEATIAFPSEADSLTVWLQVQHRQVTDLVVIEPQGDRSALFYAMLRRSITRDTRLETRSGKT